MWCGAFFLAIELVVAVPDGLAVFIGGVPCLGPVPMPTVVSPKLTTSVVGLFLPFSSVFLKLRSSKDFKGFFVSSHSVFAFTLCM